ncbi:MAG: co-chaperone DjlA [Halioglobus sp.]|nr:co-chaperone DjlA [Halioglobus sp.]
MKYPFFGKAIGGLIGLAAGGLPGLVFGVLMGHLFDRALLKALHFGSPENIERIRSSFFETTFLLSGYLAKVDGRISKSEIDHTEQVIAQMALDAQQRKRAIELFHLGAASDFRMEQAVADFVQACGPQRQLQQTLLLFLISLAHADQGIKASEHAALVRIASVMGLGAAQLEQLLRMARAQEHFQQQGAQASSGTTTLEDAYTALGVTSSASDKEVKHAYRKRMSENHPDKLIAKGVPQEMVELATARSQDIQSAYEMIKKTRPAMR